jgi:hypothetical protein
VLNNLLFQTGGSWDTTALQSNGEDLAAAELFCSLEAGVDEFGDPVPGGTLNGFEMESFVRLQEDGDNLIPVFPGRLIMQFPGHVLEIADMGGGPCVLLDGRDVTTKLVSLHVKFCYDSDVAAARFALYDMDWLGFLDEVHELDLLC